ncbi:uncharacterized protein M6B38_199835 [Iris pallida]|uniref:Myb/SANT-like domain-containing protein n=1 Tax=Iris pallida TaxID=29817 RepID=A0AAX6EAS2_IRIPA|nr:uncharacterized protein M6B38_199835 [Iris pallida]
MGDNFPNYRHFQTHTGSPFAPSQLNRRSFGATTDNQGQELEQEGLQERVTQPSPIRPIPNTFPETSWGFNIDPYMDTYSYILSEGSNPQGKGKGVAHVDNKVESPRKKQSKKHVAHKGRNDPKEGKGRVDPKEGTPNKRWEDEHTDELLKILAKEAEEGKKCDKAFRNNSYQLVVTIVNENFGTNYSVSNVVNHMRGWKVKWLQILKAENLSDAGWDDDLKKVTLDEESHEDLKKVNMFSFVFYYYVCLVGFFDQY